MKFVKQFLIILAVSLAGELIKAIIPLPIPASIYGMVLMFICLAAKLIRIESVKETSKFLIEIMPILFIPAGVGLIASWSTLMTMLIPAIVIMCVTLITVMAATGLSSQAIVRSRKKNEQKEGKSDE